jgi:hypothetical protein
VGEPEFRTYMRPVLGPTSDGGPVLERYDVFVARVDGGDTRRIGWLTATKRYFSTERSELRHRARKHEGYGIEASVVDALFYGTVEVVALVIDHEDGRRRVYHVPALIWAQEGIRDRLGADYGVQVFLPFARIVGADARYRNNQNAYEPHERQQVLA